MMPSAFTPYSNPHESSRKTQVILQLSQAFAPCRERLRPSHPRHDGVTLREDPKAGRNCAALKGRGGGACLPAHVSRARRSKPKRVHLPPWPLPAGNPALHLPDAGVGHPLPPTSHRPHLPHSSSPSPPLAMPGCGRPRAVAASRTMSPSRASKGADCTTLSSEAAWGRGMPRAAMCLLPRPPGDGPPPPLQGTIHIPPAPVAKWRRPPIPQAAHP